MRFDLHNHTVYSDGINTIAELKEKANKNNIDYFAVTDHDSVLGLINNSDPTIIKGIELSTYHNESIHLVGLCKSNIISPGLINYSYDFLEKRKNRAVKMVDKLNKIYNLKVDLLALLENADIRAVTRGNMARMIADLNPNLTKEEIKFYLSNQSEAYIPTTKMSVIDGINFLRANDCFVILAHPILYKKENLDAIIGLPFDGIEAIYPNMSITDYLYIKDIARKNNYIISAGSDCHGDKSHADIGTCYLDEEEFRHINEKICLEIKYGN